MNIEIALAGHLVAWRMQGAAHLSTWLRSRPWLELGGVRRACAAAAHRDQLLGAIRREARAADDGVSEFRVWQLRDEDLARGIRPALEEWLNVSARTEREFLRFLGDAMEVRPVLFLGWLEGRGASESVEEAHRIIESVPKLGGRSTPTMVLLHPRQPELAAHSLVLDTGFPVELSGLDKAPSEDLATTWRMYLHLRIAWENGGEVERALRCDALGFGELAVGDEAGCERLLNQHARAEFAQLPAREQARWDQWRGGQPFEGISASLSGGGAVAPGLVGAAPSSGMLLHPWLSRALLLNGAVPGVRRLLGARLVCSPLAEIILTRCFKLEALQRMRLGLHGLPEVAPEELRVRLERFKASGQSLERELYPTGHPAPPDDPWAFASLGEFLESVIGLKPHLRRPLEQLRVLRNSIAHGHYVSWRALQRLWRLEQDCA